MVLAGLFADHELFETRQGAEGVYDDLSDFGIAAQEELSLGDVPCVVGDGVGDVASREGGHGNDGDGSSRGELDRFFINTGQVGIEGSRHAVF